MESRELYEGRIACLCLAAGRKLFSALPLDEVIVTARANQSEGGAGDKACVFSVHFTRKAFEMLNFDELDPRDALLQFRCAGLGMGGVRGGRVAGCEPLTFPDEPQAGKELAGLDLSLAMGRRHLERLAREPMEGRKKEPTSGGSSTAEL